MAQATRKNQDETDSAIGTCCSDEEGEGMNVVTQSEKSEYGESAPLSSSSSSSSFSTPPPFAAASEVDAAVSSASAAGAEESKRRSREKTPGTEVGSGEGFSTDGAADDDDQAAGMNQVVQGMKKSSASARAHENPSTVEDQMGDDGMSQVMQGMNMASASGHGSTYSDVGMTSESSSSTVVVDPTDVAARQRLKWRMNLFVFVQVLMKYLEKVDPSMCNKAKKVVKECSRKKNAGDPAYKSLAVSIQVCLRQTVGEYHWVRAEQLMRQAHFRSQRSGGGGTKSQA